MKRVLIVDDSTMMRTAIEMHLDNTLYHVIGQAKNGQEAVDFAREHNPDYITLDITMPEMDGMTALEQILEINPATRIIIVTAQTSVELASEALKKGAKTFLQKPFLKEQLLEAFSEAEQD